MSSKYNEMMLCPICDSELTETEYCSKIYSVNNKYCPHCHSFHITKQNIEDAEYYNKIYHADFKYKIGELKRKLLQFFPVFAFRSMARFDFLKKHVEVKSLSTIIEIGGGTGETFWVFNKKNKLKRYTIIEPSDAMGLSHRNLHFINDIFENVDVQCLDKPDLVLMFHVLEHIFDLDAFFIKLKQTKFKYLFMEVPNIDNDYARTESLLNHPHYHHFSKKSIELLCRKHGLEIVFCSEIAPISYGNGKNISFVKKYMSRLAHKNDYCQTKGDYVRIIAKQAE